MFDPVAPTDKVLVDESNLRPLSASIPVVVESLLVRILLSDGLLINPDTLIVAVDPLAPRPILIPLPATKPDGITLAYGKLFHVVTPLPILNRPVSSSYPGSPLDNIVLPLAVHSPEDPRLNFIVTDII